MRGSWLLLLLALSTAVRAAARNGHDSGLLVKAKAGDPIAECELAWAYEFGTGLPQDVAQAAAWFRKSADQGNIGSEFSLAGLYLQGKGVAKDDVQAFKWSLKAASQGDAASQFNVAEDYGSGDGVSQDNVEAIFLVSKGSGARYGACPSQHGGGLPRRQGRPSKLC